MTTWGLQRGKGNKLDEETGVRCQSQWLTELVDWTVLRHYVPYGTMVKMKGLTELEV